jgi:hypothetical protein
MQEQDFGDKILGDVQGCSASQRTVLEAVETQVRSRVELVARELPTYTLAKVKAEFIDPENRVFDPQAAVNRDYENYISRLGAVFRSMNAEVQKGVNFSCRSDASDPQCKGGEVVAYVLMDWSGHSYPRMYACDGFFKNASSDLSDVVETMIHELSHYAADTEDYALDWWTATHIDLARAANDAYHVQQFANSAPDSVLRRQIWTWLWPRKTE